MRKCAPGFTRDTRSLEGARAIDLIHDERTEEVIAILDRLDADAYL